MVNELKLVQLRREDLHSILTCQATNNNLSIPASTSVKLDMHCEYPEHKFENRTWIKALTSGFIQMNKLSMLSNSLFSFACLHAPAPLLRKSQRVLSLLTFCQHNITHQSILENARTKSMAASLNGSLQMSEMRRRSFLLSGLVFCL